MNWFVVAKKGDGIGSSDTWRSGGRGELDAQLFGVFVVSE